MSVASVMGESDKLYDYQDFSIQCFDSVDEFVAFAELVKSKGSSELSSFLDIERGNVDRVLQANRQNE